MSHPANLENFNPSPKEPVWYLSHPLAPDDRYTFQENMDHTLKMMRLCFDEGFRVIAPYHTMCLVLDENNIEHRRIGLETDCRVANLLGRIILTGHKLSKGMQCELDAVVKCIDDYCEQYKYSENIKDLITVNSIINLTAMDDNQMRLALRTIKPQALVNG